MGNIQTATVENNKFLNIEDTFNPSTTSTAAIAVINPYTGGTIRISNNYIDGVSGLGIYVRGTASSTVIEGNHVEATDHNSIQMVGKSKETNRDVVIKNNELINWDQNRDADGGRAIRINFDPIDASTALTVTGNTFNPNDDAEPTDPDYVKITGVSTVDNNVNNLISSLIDQNTWPSGTDYGTVILVNTTKQVVQGVLLTAPKTYEIISKAGLMNLDTVLGGADLGEGKAATVNLAADIDLTGETWTPISRMWFTFNGNDHTISNLTTKSTRKAGLFGYAGAVTVNDLTLENVTVTGSQAGVFAGSGQGFTANNCFVKGTNIVNFTTTEETWNGIGAITGVLQRGTVNVTIDKDATVTLNRGDMTTDVRCVFVDKITGHITANEGGTVTNHGTVEIIGTIAYN